MIQHSSLNLAGLPLSNLNVQTYSFMFLPPGKTWVCPLLGAPPFWVGFKGSQRVGALFWVGLKGSRMDNHTFGAPPKKDTPTFFPIRGFLMHMELQALLLKRPNPSAAPQHDPTQPIRRSRPDLCLFWKISFLGLGFKGTPEGSQAPWGPRILRETLLQPKPGAFRELQLSVQRSKRPNDRLSHLCK